MGEVAVVAEHSAISRGTERLVRAGSVPPAVAHQMRAPFQVGDFGRDVKYGYLSVGVITDLGPVDNGSSREAPSERDAAARWPLGAQPSQDLHRSRVARVDNFAVGQRVFCHYPHQDSYVVPRTAITAVPDDVPPARATLAGTVETAINIVWDARPRWADRVAVVGGGLIGANVAMLLRRMRLHDLVIVDPDPAIRVLAEQLGASWSPPDQCNVEVDLVIHCSGTQRGLETGLSMLDVEGELIEASWYGRFAPVVPLGEAFHAKRLTIRASQVSQVAATHRIRRTRRDRMSLALSELADPLYD
ncbi:MAG: zinc-binding alcohol dehydrogenase, partial [Ornithinimicrobium sp.]